MSKKLPFFSLVGKETRLCWLCGPAEKVGSRTSCVLLVVVGVVVSMSHIMWGGLRHESAMLDPPKEALLSKEPCGIYFGRGRVFLSCDDRSEGPLLSQCNPNKLKEGITQNREGVRLYILLCL